MGHKERVKGGGAGQKGRDEGGKRGWGSAAKAMCWFCRLLLGTQTWLGRTESHKNQTSGGDFCVH
jgi:hypothetical protein